MAFTIPLNQSELHDITGMSRLRFRGKIVVRLVIICFFGCMTGYLFFNTAYWLAGIWSALITVGVFISTIQFIDRSERKLTAFLQALRQNDFAVTFSEDKKSDDYDLNGAFNELTVLYKKLRAERESQHKLLQVVVEQTAAPIICFEESNGDVYLINRASKELLGVPFLQKIEAIARVDRDLLNLLRGIKDGERISHKMIYAGKVIFITISASHVIFQDHNLKLVSLQDVTSELAARESETWHKLLRVLTHEISNSAIPLSTLSSHIYEMIVNSNSNDRELTASEREDIITSLKTIDQRSRTLKEFVHNFKVVGQMPEPRMEKVSVREIVEESTRLFSKELANEEIALSINIPVDAIVMADKNLTQQVFINLIKNAIEAMSNLKRNKKLEILLKKEGSVYLHVMVADSGIGISEDNFDEIFIPFFSTKKQGSGIGLSISKQIMQKQRGDLSVMSTLGKGSIFTASFIVG